MKTFPDGTTEVFTYTNLDLTGYTDRQNRTTSYQYDADRNLTQITDPLSNITKYGVFENGVLKTLTDPKGNVTTWLVDSASHLYQKKFDDNSTVNYTLDSNLPLVTSIKDALNQTKSFTYNLDNTLAGITYTGAINTTPNVSFVYDPNFLRVSSMTDGTGTTNYTYEPVGTFGALKLASENPPSPIPASAAITYSYDADGHLATRSVGSSAETFSYDIYNRLSNHTDDIGNFNIGYLAQTANVSFRQGQTGVALATHWTHKPASADERLATITNTPNGTSYTFTSKPEGDFTKILENSTYAFNYTYDTADRLLTANNPFVTGSSTTYGYDKASNLTKINGTVTYPVNNLNQDTNYTYDANGNTLSDGTLTYAWDAENRLIGVTNVGSGNTAYFSYDGLGRRAAVSDVIGGNITTTVFGWCGQTLCQARTTAGYPTARYFAEGEEGMFGGLIGAQSYYGVDQLGSVRDAIDVSTGNLMRHTEYDPWGNQLSQVGTRTTYKQYAGMFYDTASGLLLATHRVYNPANGRWLSRDPLEEAMGVNLYQYASSNPINGIDPLGFATVNGISYSGNPDSLVSFQETYNPTGFNSVVIHGNDAGQFSPNSSGGPYYSGAALADYLRAQPGYNPNLPTILVACSSGSNAGNPLNPSGAQAFAQELANPNPNNPLPNEGAPDTQTVYAPTTIVTPAQIPANGVPTGFIPVSGSK